MGTGDGHWHRQANAARRDGTAVVSSGKARLLWAREKVSTTKPNLIASDPSLFSTTVVEMRWTWSLPIPNQSTRRLMLSSMLSHDQVQLVVWLAQARELVPTRLYN